MSTRDQKELVNAAQASSVEIDSKCTRCTKSICCNSVNQKIPTPRSKENFDHLLWQVSNKTINVFKDTGGWFLHILTNRSHLRPGGVCSIYYNRPWVCREYTSDFCEFDESIKDASQLWFSSYKKLEKYCRKRFKKWEKRFELYD